MKLVLVSLIAVCLLPDTTLSQDSEGVSQSLVNNRVEVLLDFLCKVSCSNGPVQGPVPGPVLPKQCKPENYNTLSELSRSTTYPQDRNTTTNLKNCDSDKLTFGSKASPSWNGPGWYKFANPAGKKMASSPVGSFKCGTYSPGYLCDDSNPTDIGQTKTVLYCFEWDGNPRWNEIKGKVTKCGEEDFVYYLPTVPQCVYRYAAAP